MKNSISKEFYFFSLLKFALPSIVMMIVMGMYSIVDSMFVSRFVGTNALSAMNIVYPLINVNYALAIMLGTGASAVIARKLGSGDEKSARENFSFIILIGVLAGFVMVVISVLFIKPIVYALGSSEMLFQYGHDYLLTMMLFAPACILQMLFQTFFVTAGKPGIGLALTISAGVTNIILDYIFVVPLQMGVGGAALATGIGYMIPAVFGIIFFFRKKGTLYFEPPKIDFDMLKQSCYNGSSEMVINLSLGVTTFLFNLLMMKFLGEDGVAAITIILYAQFLMVSLYMGFSMGVAPVISYNYGSNNIVQIKRIFKICMTFIGISSVIVFIFSRVFASTIITIFSSKGTLVYDIAMEGFAIFPISFLFAGINIFASALFTALSNGKISAIISFLRTFLFIILGLLLLPIVFEVNGIWMAIPVAELFSLLVSVYYIYRGRFDYHYM